MKLKRVLFLLAFMLAPGVLIVMLKFFEYLLFLFWTFVVIIYVITVTAVILHFKYKPCSFWGLFTGLLISPFFVFVYEKIQNSEYLPYLLTILSTVYYALPFSVILMVIFITIKIKDRKSYAFKKDGEIHHGTK